MEAPFVVQKETVTCCVFKFKSLSDKDDLGLQYVVCNCSDPKCMNVHFGSEHKNHFELVFKSNDVKKVFYDIMSGTTNRQWYCDKDHSKGVCEGDRIALISCNPIE